MTDLLVSALQEGTGLLLSQKVQDVKKKSIRVSSRSNPFMNIANYHDFSQRKGWEIMLLG